MVASASATTFRTMSPAGISPWIAPTPWPHGMNSRELSTTKPSGWPRWLTPAFMERMTCSGNSAN